MSKRAAKTPAMAVPVSVAGLAACDLADALGIGVSLHTLRGARIVSTDEARAYIAKGAAQGHDFGEWVWLLTGHDVSMVLGC